jgi:hypothetical protein
MRSGSGTVSRTANQPVFVQESGTRKRWLRRAGAAIAACCLLYLAVVLSALIGIDLPSARLPMPHGGATGTAAAEPLIIKSSPTGGSSPAGETAAPEQPERLFAQSPRSDVPRSDVPRSDTPRAERSALRSAMGDGRASAAEVGTSFRSSGRASAPVAPETVAGRRSAPTRTSSPSAGGPATPISPPATKSTSAARAGTVRPVTVAGNGAGTSHRPPTLPSHATGRGR